MSGPKKNGNSLEEDKMEEVQLTAAELKLMKQLESGKEIEDKTVREEIRISGEKYEWFLANRFDIDQKLGLVWKDYDQISKQKKVIFHLLKEMGSNLLKGKSIMSISLPANIMEPKSMLQRLAETYVYLPVFAKKIFDEKDPLERIKCYLSNSIAALYGNLAQKKPLNPVWGETFQGYLGTPEFKIYCEQISHHPPIAQIVVECPYLTLYGTHHVEAATYPNSVRVHSIGKHMIVLKDEQKTTFALKKRPDAYGEGLVVGNRTMSYTGVLEIWDKTNKIYLQGRFNPEKQGFFEKMFNKTKSTRPDFFKGFITKNKELLKDNSRKAFYSKDMLSYFEGEWMEYLIIDGERYWELGKEKPAKLYGIDDPLQSDTNFRPDIKPLAEGNLEVAQREKDVLEDIQRKDRKLRADFKKLNKK